MITSRRFLLRLRNVSDNSCRENQNTHFVLNTLLFRKKKIRLWDMEKYVRHGHVTDDNITRHMRFACWIPKATNTHSEYVIFIAFPLQQWLYERVSMLRYTYIVCLVFKSGHFTMHWRYHTTRRLTLLVFSSSR